MSEAEAEEAALEPVVLPAPAQPGLADEARRAFLEVDRKCGIFIFPQLRQLGAGAQVDELLAAAAELAAREGADSLAGGYRELLAKAQLALREARTREVAQEGEQREQARREERIASALAGARARLPTARLSRLEQRLGQLPGEEVEAKAALIERELADWERLSQTRQSREAQRLAEQAHRVVLPRPQETARSRRARRDQAQVVELARAFGTEAPPTEDGEGDEPPVQ